MAGWKITWTWNCPALMQNQVSIHIPDRSSLTWHAKDFLHFFREFIALFYISSWNLCLMALTHQCTNAAKLFRGSKVVTAQIRSCPLAWLSLATRCTIPHGDVELWPWTARGTGWTWSATFSPGVKGSRYLTTEPISNNLLVWSWTTVQERANICNKVDESRQEFTWLIVCERTQTSPLLVSLRMWIPYPIQKDLQHWDKVWKYFLSVWCTVLYLFI